MAPVNFSSLVFFGDSLTDNGNLFALTAGAAPAPPYVAGRFSNGPTYAELVPGLISTPTNTVTVQNFAFGGAEAVTDATDGPLQQRINLASQVASFQLTLAGQPAPPRTAAAINIGNNDYLRLGSATPEQAQLLIQGVVNNIGRAVTEIATAGIGTILLFTLPSVEVTPLGAFLAANDPATLEGAKQVIAANNAALADLAAGLEAGLGVDIITVDANRFAFEVFADKETFGFKTTVQPMFIDTPTGGLAANPGVADLAADQIAFFDSIHPTAALHGITAAFTSSTLLADTVQLLGAEANRLFGTDGADLVFAGDGNDRFDAGAGDDTVFAGLGDDTIRGGDGNDLLAGGSGNDTVRGGNGDDVVAGNAGDDSLDGGDGDDVVITGSGTDEAHGGAGSDIIIVAAEAVSTPGTGAGEVNGGRGVDQLWLAVTQSLFDSAAFQDDLSNLGRMHLGHRGGGESGHDESREPAADHDRGDVRSGHIDSIGLEFEGIEHIEVQVGHVVLLTFGAPVAAMSVTQVAQLALADLWGLI